MIPYVIGLVLLIITLLIIGLIFRKRIYDAVDRHEIWKMDIVNRNTAAELARIKGLNLSGETQEKFESWKEKWEHIVTKEMPDIEEGLFEAEDAADRYRFSSANKVVHRIEQKLNTIEEEIATMLTELDELLLSEESSRKEVESIKPVVVELRQHLSRTGDAFGKAEKRYLDEIIAIEEKILHYQELVDLGDYIEAKNLVDQIKLDLDVLRDQIDQYPVLLETCEKHLPAQLIDLAAGINQMEADGYYVNHLGFKNDISNYHLRLKDCISSLEKGALSEVTIVLTEMQDHIKEMYEQLEQEAIDKSYLDLNILNYQEDFEAVGSEFEKTRAEVEVLRKSYYFDDRDMEKYLYMDKRIKTSQKELTDLLGTVEKNESSYSELRNKVESGFEEIKELKQKHEDFKNKIHNLRKEELDAKEKLVSMNSRINDLNRKLKKSNLPGVPTFIWNTLEETSKKNARVFKTLEKQPLDMSEVKQALAEAETSIDNAVEQIEMMLDQAYLTEQVIQYANRYRGSNPFLAAKLSESERLFRSFEYELSLEHAAKAIEEIEPGALKKIEANQEALVL